MEHTHKESQKQSTRSIALKATVHCLAGCSIGEVLGMVIGTAAGYSNTLTIVISIILAFIFGYSFTLLPLIRGGINFKAALLLALASDTISITLMEIIDNLIMMIIPGAMDAGLNRPLFWGSLLTSLIVAGTLAFPVNYWLILKGKGHAKVHNLHSEHAGH